MNLQQLFQQTIEHHRAGRLQAAHEGYMRVLGLVPDNPDALHLLGVLHHQVGQHERAIELIGRAIDRAGGQPNVAHMHYNLAEALRAAGKPHDAITSLRRAVELTPNYVEAHSNLALILNDLKRHDEAADAARRAIAANPNFPLAHNNLANALAQLGQVDDAITSASTAIRLQPNSPDNHNTLGICYGWRGRDNDSINSFRRAIQLDPRHADAHMNLGIALAKQEKWSDAIASLKTAVQLRPTHVIAWENLASAFRKTGNKSDEGMCYERLTQLAPQVALHWTNLGIICEQQLGQLDQAADALSRALQLAPDDIAALGTLGIVRMKQGLHDDALTLMRRSLALAKNVKLHTNLCLLANYHPTLSGEQVLEIHREWERDYAPPAPAPNFQEFDRSPDRVLRVGYVSPDFKAHASRHFIEPMLIAHDRSRFHVTCYSNVEKPDDSTNELRTLADEWREIFGKDDATVASMIREHQIDILVDLAGHTADTRLTLFALRASPLQISMVGYPSTTGLSTIDYKVSDPHVDPPGAEKFYSEELLRLDGTFWCFRPARETPEVNDLPALTNGHITFGCANNVAKITPAALDLWARILAAVPKSRMFFQHSGIASATVRQRIIDAFARHGVTEDRLTLSDWAKFADYLRLLQSFDIALDTFPFNGGTTTCQQLYLGVPCITVAGERQVSRMGVTMLKAIGLDDLIAMDEQEYVDKTIALAHDLPRLKSIRVDLRDRMLATPLGDAKTYVANLEAAYRQAWVERAHRADA